jgi:hypothetical protein
MRAFSLVVLGSLLIASASSCASPSDSTDGESADVVSSRLSVVKVFEVESVRALIPAYGRPFTFDDDTMYFTFGSELYKVPVSKIAETSTRYTVVRRDTFVTYVDAQDGTLFSIERDHDVWSSAPPPDPASWKGYLHVSTDKGKTFTAIDGGLKSCVSFEGTEYCTPLTSGVMARKIGDTIYYSAGNYPNLFATKDQGRTWHTVMGEKADQAAMSAVFDIDGSRLLMTADVNDTGAFKRFALARNRLRLATPGGTDVVPNLGYRQGYFFARRDNQKRTFVGMEGGVVRSDDRGNDWRFVFEKETFITSLAFLGDTRVLVAGNPKTGGTPTMALSNDEGTTWTDVTSKLETAIRALEPRVPFDEVAVRGLRRAPNGKVYMIYVVKPAEGSRRKNKGVLAEITVGR